MLNETIRSKAIQWTQDAGIEPSDKKEIETLLEENNLEELTERFYKDLEFGTGGLRAVLGLGSNRMSKYSVRKATHALCLTVIKHFGTQSSIAVSYDSRRYSPEFAKEVCRVAAGNGLKAYLYPELNPVCLLSWAIREKKCQAGVMVTASHNPPEYNGYKAYWNDGAQVTPPYDKEIIEAYNNIQSFSEIPLADYHEALKSQKIELISSELETRYYEMLKKRSPRLSLCQSHGEELKIVYTALHGTGKKPCSRILSELGFSNLLLVKEQAEPDENFSTVSSPNPEEPSAMKMAVDLMQKESADLAFGTDPDTDRLGVVVLQNEAPLFLSGNQIGLLLLDYLIEAAKENKVSLADKYFVNTIVTSPLQNKIADHNKIANYKTLTGFKWICNKMLEVEEKYPDKEFLFATEESFGYLSHSYVRDKDGVDSISLMAEAALYHKTQGKSLLQALDAIYERYGHSHEQLISKVYKGKEGAEKIDRIMKTFREKASGAFWGSPIEVKEDYLTGLKTSAGKEEELTGFPTSNVLGFHLQNADRVYLRPSGTEPKIKFYLMAQEENGTLEEKKTLTQKRIESYAEMIHKICDEA